MTVKVKQKVKARVKSGISAAPLDDFYKLKFYFHYELSSKELLEITGPWIKETFSKEDVKAIFANPDYHFEFPHHAAGLFWLKLGNDFPREYETLIAHIKEYFAALIPSGKQLLLEKELKAFEDAQSNVVVLSPHQRLVDKIDNTIIVDLETLEESWMAGKKTTVELYTLFKKHGLSGAATPIVRSYIEVWLEEYSNAYYKKCEQTVEAYSHILQPELKRRIKACEEMLLDLDKVKSAAKAIRQPRTPKVKTADKQIASLKFCKENLEFKLASIQPIKIIGSMRLYVFNIKTKEIIEYISSSPKGFEVKGTTLLNLSTDSRKTKLRKPNEFLSIVQTKSAKQVDNEWKKLTTKTNEANGRINQDCVLLRALVS